MRDRMNAHQVLEWIESGIQGEPDHDHSYDGVLAAFEDIAILLREHIALKDFRDWHCRTSDEGYMNEEKVP